MADVQQFHHCAGREVAVDALHAGQEQRAAAAKAVLGLPVHVHRTGGVSHPADPSPGRLQLGTRRSDDGAHPGARIEAARDDFGLAG